MLQDRYSIGGVPMSLFRRWREAQARLADAERRHRQALARCPAGDPEDRALAQAAAEDAKAAREELARLQATQSQATGETP